MGRFPFLLVAFLALAVPATLGATCMAPFPPSPPVQLTATSASGSIFTGWSGDCSGTTTSVDVTLTADKNCTATFTSSSRFGGSWDWIDTTSDGSSYRGTMTISQVAGNGSLAWTWIAGYSGTGTSTGSTLTLNGATGSLTARWVGVLDPTGRRIDGTWTQSDGQVGTFNATRYLSTPTLTVNPTSLDFGSVMSGKISTKRLSIQNAGPPGSMLNGNISSPGDPFSIVNGATAFSLASGASTTIDVQFAPSTKGKFKDAITITSNDPNSPTVVPLSAIADDLQTVTVWIDAFIPYKQFGPLVSVNPILDSIFPTGFGPLNLVDGGGDRRTFSKSPTASFRVQWLETFDANTLTPVLYSPGVGTSHLVSHLTGVVIASATPSAGTVLLDAPSATGNLVYVHAFGGAAAGFFRFPFAPAIHADVTFRIDLTNRTCQLVGTYGAFPAFEAYIQANNDPPVALLQHDVGPEPFWATWLLSLYLQQFNTVTGTAVPF